jgi:regulator of sigma E protease
MAAFIFIIVLSVLVIIHEAGHFLAAKRNKIRVKEFGLGYPPRARKLFTWRGTIFSLNWIPFGGFVQMDGENGPEEQEAASGSFYNKSIRARLEVLLAGVLFNFVFGILAFAVVFYNLGVPVLLSGQARIHEVLPESPAAQAGLEPNTSILAFQVNGEWVETREISQIQSLVAANLGQTVQIRTSLACEQEKCPDEFRESSIYLRTQQETPDSQGAMGVIFSEMIFKSYPWYQMPFATVIEAFKQSLALAALILQALWQLIVDLGAGRGVQQEIAGPIGIVDQASTYGFFEGGWLSILNFAALLSINLGIINLLPIPALDGGRAVLVMMEKLIKRKYLDHAAHYLNYFGYISLLALMLFVTFNDLKNLFK